MRLLQKLAGLEWLERAFLKHEEEDRHWFKGYHVYSSQDEVLRRFREGISLSCFGTTTGGQNLHVAYSDNRFEVKYLTVEYNRTDMFIHETGVHFCQFSFVRDGDHVAVASDTRGQLLGKIDRYALMLPYKKYNYEFIQQFTLVYHDWDVLVCNDTDETVKGFPDVNSTMFGESYIRSLA